MRFCGALALGATAAALAGCLSYENHVVAGNADGVIIQYFGDRAATVPLARQHCAQYERVPRFVSEDEDKKATYACVAPDLRRFENGGINLKLTLITDFLRR